MDKSQTKLILIVLFILAISGFCGSSIAHVYPLLYIDAVQDSLAFWPLFVGVFIVFIPTTLMARKIMKDHFIENSSLKNMVKNIIVTVKNSPRWMVILCVGLLIYAPTCGIYVKRVIIGYAGLNEIKGKTVAINFDGTVGKELTYQDVKRFFRMNVIGSTPALIYLYWISTTVLYSLYVELQNNDR